MAGTTTTVPVKMAERDLEGMLERLHWGETLTLVNAKGVPLAVVVSLKPTSGEIESSADWWSRWDALTQQVSQVWKGDKSAVEILTEMRR